MHAHVIVFLDTVAKFSIQDPSNVYKLISAKITPVISPHLRELVLKHMVHDPCNANTQERCIG